MTAKKPMPKKSETTNCLPNELQAALSKFLYWKTL